MPFVFDLEHSKCPNDGHELQVQQMTPMPRSAPDRSKRSRDIASVPDDAQAGRRHLSRRRLSWTIQKLKSAGQFLVRNYGCAGCHEIAGLEEEQRIGTELTKEGSKPLERLDFALLGHDAHNEGWYTHKGFFEHKLENPAIYDQGKEEGQAGPLEDAELQSVASRRSTRSRRSCWARWIPACRRAITTCRPISGRTSSKAGGWSASTTAWAAIRCMSGRPPPSRP